jgi:hypothetical protein
MLYTPSSEGGATAGLLAYQINADGSLTNAPSPSYMMPYGDSQVGLVAHPTANFLYSPGYAGVLTVFAIDSATGALSPTSSVTLGKFLGAAVITPNGRAGVARWKLNSSYSLYDFFTGSTYTSSTSHTGTDFAWGIGVQAHINIVGARLEYEQFNVNSNAAKVASLSVFLNL